VDADDCGAGSSCDPDSRRCRCVADDACGPGEFCGADGTCNVGCRIAPDDCAQGQRCDPVRRVCGCAADGACDANEFCRADGVCTVGCRTEPNNCVLGVCDAASRRCLCGGDDDCPENEYCSAGGTCEGGCRTEPDSCGQGVCDPALRICAPPACRRDADCGANQACTVIQVADALALRCVPALAQGRENAPCATGLECASRLCVNEAFCFSACGDGADCASGACGDVNVNDPGVPGGPFVFQTCEPPNVECAADAMCPGPQQCLPVGPSPVVPNAVELGCVPDQPGAAGGAPCVDGAACASGNCLNEGVCWGPCRFDQGAADCGAGQRCYQNQIFFVFDQDTPRTEDDAYYGLPACLPDTGSGQPCRNTRCGAGETCRLAANGTQTGWAPECRRNVGNGAGGAFCARDGDCRSGTCLVDAGFCFAVCEPGVLDNCAAGTVCQVLDLTVSDRGTPGNELDDVLAPIGVCLP
jgi:hypothetical protein